MGECTGEGDAGGSVDQSCEAPVEEYPAPGYQACEGDKLGLVGNAGSA